MKKIFAAFIAGAMIAIAVPALAAETGTDTTAVPAYCQQNCPRYAAGGDSAGNNGPYCNGPHHGRHCGNAPAQSTAQ